MKVLFICEGNIMRSQMGEVFYNHRTKTKDAFSAGAMTSDGRPVHSGVIEAMKAEGIDMTEMTSTVLTRDMFDSADKVIAFPTPYMPDWVLNDPKTEHWDVSDPYYMPDDGTNYVERARDRIKQRVEDLIKTL
ncbi:hypothetical protein CR956_00880 [Candidatus Saccharibacteria bacterium]|nr:MAG: hypothetical protein CR956_00880 [Candidatus Saccharibacteria bacterium]